MSATDARLVLTPPAPRPAAAAAAVRPARSAYTPPKAWLSQAEYAARVERLSGSIDDPTFMRPPQPMMERPVLFDDEPPLEPELLPPKP